MERYKVSNRSIHRST